MRSLRFSILVLCAALAPSPAQQAATDSVLSVSPKQISPPALVLTITSAPAHPDVPMPGQRPAFPIEALAMVAMATKRATRRTAGKKRSGVAMYLDSHVDVMREDKDGNDKTVRITGGVLVDDTDLSDDEIDELTARRVIRPATPEEIDRLEAGDVAGQRAALATEQEAEVAELKSDHAAERQKLERAGKLAKPEQVAKLEEKQAGQLAKLTAKHTDALNAIGE